MFCAKTRDFVLFKMSGVEKKNKNNVETLAKDQQKIIFFSKHII